MRPADRQSPVATKALPPKQIPLHSTQARGSLRSGGRDPCEACLFLVTTPISCCAVLPSKADDHKPNNTYTSKALTTQEPAHLLRQILSSRAVEPTALITTRRRRIDSRNIYNFTHTQHRHHGCKSSPHPQRPRGPQIRSRNDNFAKSYNLTSPRSQLGRLTHWAFDAVLLSAFLAGVKRSTGLT
jgi:hypothetical protein